MMVKPILIIHTTSMLVLLEAFTPSSLPSIRISHRSKSSSTKYIGPLHALGDERDTTRPFINPETPNTKRNLVIRSYVDTNTDVESKTATENLIGESDERLTKLENQESSIRDVASQLSKITGTFDKERLAFPEIASGEVSRVFSNISYQKEQQGNGNIITRALHAPGSVAGAAALVAGTTIGAGILALPTATAPSGFLPSSTALCIAWLYMTISGLLIAELSINRIGQTGRTGVGLLELYKSSLTKELAWVGSAAYLFLHYAVMVAYISQGGAIVGTFLDEVGIGSSISSIHGMDQLLFATFVGGMVYLGKPSEVENINNILVLGVITSFLGIIGLGVGTADFSALVAPVNQHPELVVDAFPICFLSLVYQNVVPTVVTQLEGDREKITKSLVIGTSVPLIMFLAWNAVILGNIVNFPDALQTGLDPISFLRSEGVGGETLSQFVSVFSELAVTTSLIGFIYGMLDALTDAFQLPVTGPKFNRWKPLLFAGALLPPFLFSLGNPDIFYEALEYGGAFGVSTLFLVLPPIMAWQQRYGESNNSLTVPPMVPFGKIPLGSLWKAAGTLILEQGADKLGVFDFFKELFAKQGWFS